MITINLINEYYDEVKLAIDESIDSLKKCQKRENDFVLFLAQCSLKIEDSKHIYQSTLTYECFLDKDRERFVDFYLNLPIRKLYPTLSNEEKSDTRKNLMFLEMMIYSHLWEAIPNLRMLFRISELSKGNDYPWEINVPEMGKHSFIREQVRDNLGLASSKLKDLISNTYNSQIRNAFAHSQISFFNEKDEVAQLLNHNKNDNWTQWGMSFEELEIKITKSILLFKLIPLKIHEEILKILNDQNNNEFTVYCPSEDWSYEEHRLILDEEKLYFKWK